MTNNKKPTKTELHQIINILASYQVNFEIQGPKYYKMTIEGPVKEMQMGSKFTPAQRQEIKEIVLEAIKEAVPMIVLAIVKPMFEEVYRRLDAIEKRLAILEIKVDAMMKAPTMKRELEEMGFKI